MAKDQNIIERLVQNKINRIRMIQHQKQKRIRIRQKVQNDLNRIKMIHDQKKRGSKYEIKIGSKLNKQDWNGT